MSFKKAGRRSTVVASSASVALSITLVTAAGIKLTLLEHSITCSSSWKSLLKPKKLSKRLLHPKVCFNYWNIARIVSFNFKSRIFGSFGWLTLLTHSGQVGEDTEEHEDSQKIKVPDPSIDEEAGKMQPLETPDKDNIEDTTLIEGAWADILGSGQLKKKVNLT